LGLKALSKIGLLAALFALAVLLTGKTLPASALPTTLTLNGTAGPISSPLGGNVAVVSTYQDEGASFILTATLSTPGVGYFWGSTVINTNADGQTITPANPIVGTTTTQITITDDVDGTAETTTVLNQFLCVAAGTATFAYTQGGGASASYVLTCGASALTTSTATPTVNVAFQVNGTCGAAGQALTSSPAASGAFSAPITNGTLVPPSTVTCVAAGPISANYICTVAGVVNFLLNGAPASVTCGGAAAGGLTVSSTTGMSGTVTGTCPGAGTPLTQIGPAAFTGATLNGVAVAGITAGSISCTAAGTLIATFVCNTTGTVSFALGAATGTFYCSTTTYNPCLTTYLYNNCGNYCGAYGTQYAYNCNNNCGTYGTVYTYANNYNCNPNCIAYSYQPTYGCNQSYPNAAVTPSSLTITAGSPTVACGQTAQVKVVVSGSNGGMVQDGTAVALAASVGTLTPGSSSTAGGAVTATYTAPANVPATNVTLRATAGAATNTTSVSITCTQTATAPASPPPAPVSIPTTLPVITPPSTGDAGLLALLKDDACVD
jgi:hypothetical protein